MKNNALNVSAGVRLDYDMLLLLVGALRASKNCRRLWNSQAPPPPPLPVTEEFCSLWGVHQGRLDRIKQDYHNQRPCHHFQLLLYLNWSNLNCLMHFATTCAERSDEEEGG